MSEMTLDLNPIVGEKLSAVTFVADYLQLHFDGPVLTSVTHPRVVIDGKSYSWDSPCYKDKVCKLIFKSVIRTKIVPEKYVRIDFERGNRIEISIRPEDYVAGEALWFDANGEHWVV